MALLVVVMALVLVVALSTSATAHAFLSDSDPSNGEQLAAVPSEITLTFSGDGVVVADVSVVGPDGADVSGNPEIDPDDTQRVSVPIEEDAGDGMYVVEWEVLADDGHTTAGTFFFSVGEEPLDRETVVETLTEDEDEDASAVESAAKGVLLVGLVALVGVPITARFAVSPALSRIAGRSESGRSNEPESIEDATTTVDARLRTVLVIAALAALLGAAVLGVSRGFHGILTETLGQLWLTQLAVSSLLAVLLGVSLTGSIPRRAWLSVSLAGGVVLTATVSWSSHSATAIDRLDGTLVDFGHVAGAGLWIGGLVVLAVVGRPLLDSVDPAERATVTATVVRRYSVLALAGVTLAASTGLVLAGWHVETVDGLFETLYGSALSTKTVLVAVALGLGGFTRFVLLRRLESPDAEGDIVDRTVASIVNRVPHRDRGGSSPSATRRAHILLSRTIRVEVVVLVAVVLLSGVLTSVATPAVLGDGPQSTTVERSFDDDTIAEIELLPVLGDPDAENVLVRENEPLVVDVAFTDGDELVTSDGTVRLLALGDDGTEIELLLEPTGDGTYGAVQPLPNSGAWELRITGFPDGTFGSAWFDVHAIPDVGDHGHDHDHGGADGPFVTFLRLAAIAVGLVGSVAVVLEAFRTRNR